MRIEEIGKKRKKKRNRIEMMKIRKDKEKDIGMIERRKGKKRREMKNMDNGIIKMSKDERKGIEEKEGLLRGSVDVENDEDKE